MKGISNRFMIDTCSSFDSIIAKLSKYNIFIKQCKICAGHRHAVSKQTVLAFKWHHHQFIVLHLIIRTNLFYWISVLPLFSCWKKNKITFSSVASTSCNPFLFFHKRNTSDENSSRNSVISIYTLLLSISYMQNLLRNIPVKWLLTFG